MLYRGYKSVIPNNTPNKWRDNPMGKIDTTKAIKMKLRGSTYREIADAMNTTHSHVHATIAPIIKNMASPKELEEYRQKQVDVLDSITMRTLQSINDNDYQKASLLQKTTAACQLIDKSRLVSGQTTANVGIMGYFNAVTETREAIDITDESDNE